MPYFGNNPSPLLLNTVAQNGKEMTLDADADTSITADTDDQIDIKIAGADDFQFTANTFTVKSGSTIVVDDTTDSTSTTTGSIQTDGGVGIAKDLVVGDDILLKSDASVIHFGADSEVTLTHVADTGLLLNDRLEITTADNIEQLRLSSTDADANEGPLAILHRNSSSPADGDSLGRIYFSGENDNDEEIQYVRFQSIADDVSDGTEDSSFRIQTYVGGAVKSKFFTSPTETVFNDDAASHNFRVEGATSTHALFVKGDDSNIGMGTNSTDRMGSANTRGVVTMASNSYAVFEMVNGDSDGNGNVNTINFVYDNNTAANNGQVVLLRSYTDGTTAGHRGGRFSVFTKNNNATGLNEHFRIDKAGNITATDTSIGSISDERLKKNMEDFTYSIDDFKKYKPKKYDWKNPEVHGGKSGQWGFSAQDVEKIDERFVDEYLVHDTEGIKDEEGNQIVHPDKQYLDADNIAKSSKLQQKDAMYISVIQQLVARIEALEAEVKVLKEA